MGIGFSIVAVALDAPVIEEHFTLSLGDGVDAAFSMEPKEFADLVIEARRAFQSLGRITYGPTEAETGGRLRRRSLYISQDLEPGDSLTPRNLRKIRPGLGLPPKNYSTVLGMKVTQAVKAGTPVGWDPFK